MDLRTFIVPKSQDLPASAPPSPTPPPPTAPERSDPQYYTVETRGYYPIIKKKKDKSSALVTAVLTVLLTLVVVYLLAQCQRRPVAPAVPIATLLTNSGWKFYTKPGCTFCDQQLKTLGGSYPNTVTCGGTAAAATDPAADDSAADPCAGIPAFPFWVNEQTGAVRSGAQTLDALHGMAKNLK